MALIDDVAQSAGGSGFNNSILAGQGTLIRTAIESPNYVPGVSGWAIFKNGHAEFNSITIPVGAGGNLVFVQGTPPTASNINDVWLDTANGNQILYWSGAAWTGVLQNGADTIQPGTITAALLIAGIVVAGIVDATTITAATFNGSTFNGTDFIINSAGAFFYNGTPATGNLIASIAAASGTDVFGNAYRQGVGSYGIGGSFINLLNNQIKIGSSTSDSGGHIVGGSGQINYTSGVAPVGDTNAALVLISQLTSLSGNNPQVLIGATATPSAITGEMLEVQGNIAVQGTMTAIVSGAEETWHSFSLVGGTSAGTDINGTAYPPAYRLLPDGDVALRGVVSAGAGGLATGITWAVIPAAYRPSTRIPVALISNGTKSTLAHVYIRPNGNVQFDAALGAGVSMYIDCILHLAGN